MFKRISLVGVLVAVLGLFSATFGIGAQSGETIKVGALFDLTGPTSGVGVPWSEGLNAYVDWLNSQGGLGGRPLELVSGDSKYQVDAAHDLYEQFVHEDGVVAMLGWGTADTEALKEEIAADEIPFMSASYSANLADIDAAPYNFLLSATYSDQTIVVMQWALDNWVFKGNDGVPNIAIIHHDSAFGTSTFDAFGPDGNEFAEAKGITLITIPMPAGATDYIAQLTEAEDAGANYIIIQNVAAPAVTLAQNAEGFGIEAQLICLNWCSDEIFAHDAGTAAEGVVGVFPFAPAAADLPGMNEVRTYFAERGQDIIDLSMHAPQAWWSMAVMVEGIRRVIEAGDEVTGANIRAALENSETIYTGEVTPPLTFSSTDHRGTRSVYLYQVVDGHWVPISDLLNAEDIF
jgi:branched-chain amino acid transport system substrate-binding protein